MNRNWHPLDGNMIAADAHYDPDDDWPDDDDEYSPDDPAQRGYDDDREENRDAD
jgi:hypothetical protein